MFFPGICLHAFFLPKTARRTLFSQITQNPLKKSNGRPLKSTNYLVSWQILICQSFLKAFETIGDKTLKGRREEFVSTYPYLESPYGRTDGDVITKFSRMDSLPNFITSGAPLRVLLARRLRYQIIVSLSRQKKLLRKEIWSTGEIKLVVSCKTASRELAS